MTLTARPSGQPAQDRHQDLHVVSPAPRDVWRDLLSADPGALPTQTPEWTDWLCRRRSWADASRLYEFADGTRVLLPLVARVRAGLQVTAESMPYGYGYGGPLVPGGRVPAAAARAVVADLANRPVLRAGLVPHPLAAGDWSAAASRRGVQVPFLAHVLDLRGGFPQVWRERYRKVTRKNVRRGMRQPLDVREGRDEASVEVFAELNRRSVERWAQQRRQPRWLARLVDLNRDRSGQLASALSALGPMLTLRTAQLAGEPVAAYAHLHFGEQAYGWMSAMDGDLAGRTNAGALLQSLAIEDACSAGSRWFLMGESDRGSGVGAFKERFGAQAVPYTALRFERLPLTSADRRLRAIAGRVTSAAAADTDAGDR